MTTIIDLTSFIKRCQETTGMVTLPTLTAAEVAVVRALESKRRVAIAGGYIVPTGPALNYVLANDTVLEDLTPPEPAAPAAPPATA